MVKYEGYIEKAKKDAQKLNKLEEIVSELEQGNIDLDDAINKYTEAMKLAKDCSDKLNKVLTTDHGSFSREDKFKVAISLGDVLNNISNIATDLGLTMNDIISINLTKNTKKSDT